MQSMLRYFAMLNLIFVLALSFGAHVFVYPAMFTAFMLFVYNVQDASRTLRFMGTLFNFIGVAGVLAGVPPMIGLAITGAIFLFIDHISSRSRPKPQNEED